MGLAPNGVRFLNHYLGNTGVKRNFNADALIRGSSDAFKNYYKELNQAMNFVEQSSWWMPNLNISFDFSGINWDGESTSRQASLDWWLALRGYNDSGRGRVTCNTGRIFTMEYTYLISKYYNFDPNDVFLMQIK